MSSWLNPTTSRSESVRWRRTTPAKADTTRSHRCSELAGARSTGGWRANGRPVRWRRIRNAAAGSHRPTWTCCTQSYARRQMERFPNCVGSTTAASRVTQACDVDAGKQERKIGAPYRDRSRRVLHRPGEGPALEPFIQDPKSRLVPRQDLEPIPAPIAKEKQMAREWIQGQSLAHHCRETINRRTEIGRAGRHVNPHRRRQRQRHGRKTCTTRRSVSAEISSKTRTRSPLASTISSPPPPSFAELPTTWTGASFIRRGGFRRRRGRSGAGRRCRQ